MWTKVVRRKEVRQSKRILVVTRPWLSTSRYSLTFPSGRSYGIFILPKLIQDECLHLAAKYINVRFTIANVNELNFLTKKVKDSDWSEHKIGLFIRKTSKI